MRIHVLSDLHQEFREIDVPQVDCDCVVLAGDIANKRNGLKWIQRRFPEVPVIYICGNHEYYSAKLPALTEALRRETQGTNIHFLEDESVTIGGVHFFACTLWTDLALYGDWMIGAVVAGCDMNDYKRIRNSAHRYRHLTAGDTRYKHLVSLQAMEQFFATHEAKRSVIVTHHAPSIRSLPEHRKLDPISCAYASDLEGFIARHQPPLWIHGHIHHSNDYQIGETRVLSNPRAYPDDPNPGFIPDLVVTVEPLT